jgi:hypothetical protein
VEHHADALYGARVVCCESSQLCHQPRREKHTPLAERLLDGPCRL